jgi:ATP-dependent DNA helicase DinG
MNDLETVLGAGGALAGALPGFQPRAQQRELAEAIAQTLQNHGVLVAEAGTGTGKTLAYLAPAVLSGARVLVATGTKNLQDQLFDKDIPLLRQALRLPFQAALLKGRANYLCHYRLENAVAFEWQGRHPALADYEKIRVWAGRTQSGDIAEIPDVPESAPVWPAVTSTADNCLGQDCPELQRCFLLKARRKAQDARIVVINHHLLCAEWRLRQDGFGELLADADAVIVDEAHQLAETASQFLGLTISARQLVELARDSHDEQRNDAPDMKDLGDAAERLEHRARDLRQHFAPQPGRGSWTDVENNPALLDGLDALPRELDDLSRRLETAAARGKGLESCWKRALELRDNLRLLRQDDAGDWVRWYETFRHSYSFSRTPLAIAGEFQRFMASFGASWIFVSATLSVNGRFDHFTGALGLTDAQTRRWDSPFDYPRQSLCYLPSGLPEPAGRDYTRAAVEAAVPVLRASRGRAFFLFTSHQALQDAAGLLEDRLEFPLYVQGRQPKPLLLEQFKRHGNAVLLGTSSFWEGVDVRGEALSCVIIDKLPFASPGDPVLKARIDALRRRGVEPFTTLQLPAAVIALKQGAGRLIRDTHDRGVLMLCDPRLRSKSYGRVFLDSLPPMRRTQRLEEVEAFFAESGGGA